MALHRLTSITMGVPNVADTAAYYAEFGLSPDGDGWFTTRDAGRQLRIVHAPTGGSSSCTSAWTTPTTWPARPAT